MDNKLYNDKEEFEDLRKILSGMPEIGTPDNFEFNLMVRIRNKNFETGSDKRIGFALPPFLIPAAALTLSVFLVVLLVNPFSGSAEENLLMTEPQLRDGYAAESSSGSYQADKSFRSSMMSERSPARQASQVYVRGNSYDSRIVVHPNDVVTTEKRELPFNDSKAVALDSFVKGAPKKSRDRGQGMLTGYSSGRDNTEYFEFSGFFFSSDEQAIQDLRARMDSIKKFLMNSPR